MTEELLTLKCQEFSIQSVTGGNTPLEIPEHAQEQPDARNISNIPPVSDWLFLTIPRSRLEKMLYCSKKLSEISSRELELYFYLVSDSEFNSVDEVVVAHGQIVSETSCIVSQIGKIKSFEECSRTGKIIGWAHSHAVLPVFHSAQDNSNTISMLAEYPCHGPSPDVRLIYSLVINSLYETPYASVGIQIKDLTYIVHNILINVTDDGVYVPEPGIEELLFERVRWQP